MTYTIFGTTVPATGGQLPARLHSSLLSPNPSSQFLTLCTDLFNDLGLGVNGRFWSKAIRYLLEAVRLITAIALLIFTIVTGLYLKVRTGLLLSKLQFGNCCTMRTLLIQMETCQQGIFVSIQ